MEAGPRRTPPQRRAPLAARAVVAIASGLFTLAVVGLAFGAPGAVGGQVLGALALLAGAALVASALAVRELGRSLRAADRILAESRTALRLVADWYWEQDHQFRFTHVSDPGGRADPATLTGRIGKTPWEVADIGMSEAQLDRHRADLERHRPFSGLIVRRRDPKGRLRVHSISGEPRFSVDGVFEGYWGVARDVTDEIRARRAHAASETRYRELFESSPSPIFLHRQGVIFDANPSAARLFGFADAASVQGTRLADLHPPGEWRQRALERIAELERLPIGEGVPVRDFEVCTVDGRPISVQGMGVRVDANGGPATLTMMFDITARLAAESALRRSEAMLSQLFATSPDCITLYERSTARHTLVNAAFTRLTGYSAEEVAGRTADDLGLWHDPADRVRLTLALDSDGRIDEMPARIATRSGRIASVLISAARFTMDRRDYVVTNTRDVTDSARTQLEHAAIFQRASIGIAMTRDRRFVQANPRFEAIFGWPPGELVGQPGSSVWPDEAAYEAIGRLAGPLLSTGDAFEIECEVKKRDGSRFWARLLGQAVDPQRPGEGGTIWIADDVTERRRLDAALAAARDAAEAASRAKSAFLANTSHEIRTPLNGLLGLARLALGNQVTEAQRQQHLEQILACAQGLEGILTDILDFSKIEAGKFTLEATAFDLRELLGAVLASYRPLTEAKGLSLALEIDPSLATAVNGDPVRIRQILGNFLTNAVKFTHRGGIHIAAAPGAEGRVRLTVSDSGDGVDSGMVPLLFQPFSQGDASTTRRVGGTGLGLSICRQLARLMGGEVGVESTVGAGSSFWAELPLPATVLPGNTLGTEAIEHERLRGAHILLVEDNPVNMMIAAATLTQWGVAVAEAHDGRDAVEAVHEAARAGHPFDLVLMDVQMPVMSGHEAALALRKDWDAETLPIIALTAAALVSERDLALAAGMNDFLTKPIDAPKLRRTLARHVRRSRGQAVAEV